MPDCAHTKFRWISPIGTEAEKRAGARGYWGCLVCGQSVANPMGTGECPRCKKPLDDHQLVGQEAPRCMAPA